VPNANDAESAGEERGTARVAVRLTLASHEVDAQFEVPAGPARWEDMLQPMRLLTEAAVAIAVRHCERAGRTISCRAGCGACCRQLVPISEFEARQIQAVVDAMPEPRQSVIRERFAHAHSQLEAAGLLETLEHQREFDSDSAGRLGNDYFRQQIACPFLEDESCSIYEQRPIKCREYLVTTPAEHCAAPEDHLIEQVPLPISVAATNARLQSPDCPSRRSWVALSLALDWAASHPPGPAEHTGPELLHEFLVKVTQRPPANAVNDESG
jgi:Fe-S-cluster containining protein